MVERRKWKRYTVAYPIEGGKLRVNDSLNLVDVSQGGIAFTGAEEVRTSDKINIHLFLKNRMFHLKAVIVYVKQLKKNIYNIGAKFFNVPEDFPPTLDKEIEEITQFRRECNLYNHKSLSFRKASAEYLKNTPPSKA
jgi:hypothetical protein